MRTPTSTTEREAGFTLVELLAVLAILSLAVAAFAYRTGTSLATANLRAAILGTASALREARGAAISRQSEQIFVIDTARRQMRNAAGGPAIVLPDGVKLTVTSAESLTSSDGTTGIKFYPDGTSTGGVLAFDANGRIYTLQVNWLTGHVSLAGI